MIRRLRGRARRTGADETLAGGGCVDVGEQQHRSGAVCSHEDPLDEAFGAPRQDDLGLLFQVRDDVLTGQLSNGQT